MTVSESFVTRTNSTLLLVSAILHQSLPHAYPSFHKVKDKTTSPARSQFLLLQSLSLVPVPDNITN